MKPSLNIETGKLGENLACDYLMKKGFKILYRNYKEKWDEIDIIASAKDKTLVFIEVKTANKSGKSANDGLLPEDNLTRRKLSKIKRASEMFVAKHPSLIFEKAGWRLDLIALTVNNKDCVISHYENI